MAMFLIYGLFMTRWSPEEISQYQAVVSVTFSAYYE